ncbi:MAG: MbnP family protein [Crocinitomicaceae bacterium]
MKFLLLLCVIASFYANGQRNIFIHLDPVFSGNTFDISNTYIASDNSIFLLDHFDYYVSNFTITHDGGQQTTFFNLVFLIEPANHTVYLGYLPIQQIEKVEFLVGVPKELNTQSGVLSQDISLYPETHPLSFQTPSMYWGWQAGYMHMIIGGWNDVNGNNTIESNEGYFELHNLGDQNQQAVSLSSIIQTNTSSDQTDIFIDCHLDRWIQSISLGISGITHGSTGVNETILDNVVTKNVFEQSPSAGMSEETVLPFSFTTAKGEIVIHWSEAQPPKHLSVLSMDGKSIFQYNFNEFCEKSIVSSLISGLYHISTEGENGACQKTVFVP